MKVPMRWLADIVDTGLPPAELARRLTMAGLEAEKIEEIGAGWDNVFVGHVDRVEGHPDADRLVLADVQAGEHRLTVVTGAPNIAVGQTVALALAGARLIDGYSDTLQYKTLKPGVIRGVRSEGMVCSEKELGLSGEHEGILVLEPEAPVGAPLADWLGDTVIEFEITPNLVHAFSVLGIAREAAAVAAAPLRLPPTFDLGTAPTGEDELVRIEAPDLCQRYAAVVIEGIQVGPSPAWLARRLAAAGLRSINNVVDVTNYVMLEWGQPLHAFDKDRLHEGRIIVRRAAAGETIETLDHQVRSLGPDMLVIADADRPVGIAGVMGGLHSEVSDDTMTVILEAATFDMRSIRRTARDLRLRTDASARFERGLDPELVGPAAARAARLLLDLNPDSRVTAVRDVYPQPVQPHSIIMPFGLIERILGVAFDPAIVLDALTRLGFDPALAADDDQDRLTVQVPTYRHDVSLPEDVVEEVARIVGYDTLPETLPAGRTPPVVRDPMFRLQTDLRGLLAGAGCTETITYVAASEQHLLTLGADDQGAVGFVHRAPLADLVRLRNPLQSDRSLLRPTIVPSLLEVAAENLKHQTAVRLFELARVYLPQGRDALPREVNVCTLLLAGQRDPVNRFATPGDLDFFDLKGIVDVVASHAGVRPSFHVTALPGLHPGRAATLSHAGKPVGVLGELRPDVSARFGLADHRVAVAEIDLDALLVAAQAVTPEVRVPRFLPVQQDFAVVVAEETPAADVERALLTGAGALATGIALFDVFRGTQIGENRKSLAYRVTFTAPDRALTDSDLGKARGRIEKVLAQRVGGTLRA
ncbi:MAG: phenylalanine--tRNA ligase subunit beta [Chloroflexota bacterium]|nr:phenylalanine--tRNA ligase subunit beta [Chloroflexota bacterium]MDP9471707.1 phenylalanine--tRNA ligase subunit beta [Chloroflexota bacterium]